MPVPPIRRALARTLLLGFALGPPLAPARAAGADGPAPAAAPAENPVYRNWARFRPGASASYRVVTVQPSSRSEMTLTYTLVAVSPKEVVVESVARLAVNGKEVRMPPNRLTNPRFAGGPAAAPGKPAGLVDEGSEPVEAAGRTLPARWTRVKARTQTAENLVQTWSSDDVPGALVRSLTTVPGAVDRVSLDLIELKTP